MSQIKCTRCGKGVSSEVPAGTIVRAWVECPECTEKSLDSEDLELTLDFDTLQKVLRLEQRRNNDLDLFGENTCRDYVDSLHHKDGRFGVTIFVEPCGDLTKWGDSWAEVLDWWIAVFDTQPEGWDYVKAGWYLHGVAKGGLPDDPAAVWLESEVI